MIGLCGANGTGKTTLAKAFAEKNNVTFAQTNASDIFKELGLNPAETQTFDNRMLVQEEILRRFDVIYSKHIAEPWAIADRTPIDLMAYVLSECQQSNTTPIQQARLAAYMQSCIDVINRRFSALVVVQPGIPMVEREGKASGNAAFVEHLNAICMGLINYESIEVPHFYIYRSMTGLNDRVNAVEFIVKQATRFAQEDYAKYQLNGRKAN